MKQNSSVIQRLYWEESASLNIIMRRVYGFMVVNLATPDRIVYRLRTLGQNLTVYMLVNHIMSTLFRLKSHSTNRQHKHK